MSATNFDELVILVAEEAPHALVLDWYRRLELTLRAYLSARGLNFVSGVNAERVVAEDALLGPAAAATMRELRTIRNKHTHGWEPLAAADSVAFAHRAFALIGAVMRVQGTREIRHLEISGA